LTELIVALTIGTTKTSQKTGWLMVLASVVSLPARAQLFLGPDSQDVKQGAEVARIVEQQIGICSNEKTTRYLQELTVRLVIAVNDQRWNFNFQIVDQAEPNAFAIPGGGIYVSRGLLVLVNREDELAGVLGHEMAHVTQRHSAKQQRKGLFSGLLSLPGKVVGGVVGDDLGAVINAPVAVLSGVRMSAYGRSQEKEADRIGIATATKAGYQPDALADILLRLDRDVASQSREERKFSIFDSHPMTETRLKNIQSQSGKLTPARTAAIAPTPAALYANLDGLWWGNNPETGQFEKDTFLQPVGGFAMRFPPGWKHRNTPQYVISAHPKQEAMLLLGIQGPSADPAVLGRKFVQKMREKARAEPASVSTTSIGEYPAFVVTYLDRSGGERVYLHLAWVAMGSKTYELIGLAPEKHRESLRNAALTLRPLTDIERAAVTGKRLRIVSAQEGDTLEKLGARAGNVWSPAYTALVNGLEPGERVREGRLFKIARQEPAVPSDR
jgi:predicted Zn-dependent protease